MHCERVPNERKLHITGLEDGIVGVDGPIKEVFLIVSYTGTACGKKANLLDRVILPWLHKRLSRMKDDKVALPALKYSIQYLKDDKWRDYTSQDDTVVEFPNLVHAQTVARDLVNTNGLPKFVDYWRVVDSEKTVHRVTTRQRT